MEFHLEYSSIQEKIHIYKLFKQYVSFCFLFESTNDDVFDDLPKIYNYFPKTYKKVSKRCPEAT